MSAEDLFSQFFGGGVGPFGSMFGGGGGRNHGPRKPQTIHHTLKVSLEDLYRGTKKKLALQKSVICPACHGRGGKEGAVRTCAGCNGQGMKTMMRQMGPMIQRFQTMCPDCQGEGEIIRERDRCRRCGGKKTVVERTTIDTTIDRGMKTGQKIDHFGEGDQEPGMPPGDVQFELEEKPHPRFQRKDNDLFHRREIDLVTALTGGLFYIEHLEQNKWLKVRIPRGSIIKPGTYPAPCHTRIDGADEFWQVISR